MGLAFKLTLPADKRFLSVWEIPKLTASAIYPPQTGEPADECIACELEHERALARAIEAGMVTPLNPLSYEKHTFPFGDALQSALISLDDFKLFAGSLQIEAVLESDSLSDAPSPEGYLTIEEAASALACKYGFNKPTAKTMLGQLSRAADRGELVVRHPHTRLSDMPETRRDFYELVRIQDLNGWLEKEGVEYRLDNPEQEQHDPSNSEQSGLSSHTANPIDRNEVMAAFTVKTGPDANRAFWDDKLSRPPKWLRDARIGTGKPGTSSLWSPLILAHCLLDERHMSIGQLDVVMNKRFPDLFDSWEEQTDDAR